MQVREPDVHADLARLLLQEPVQQFEHPLFFFKRAEQLACLLAGQMQVYSDKIAGAFHVDLRRAADIQQSKEIFRTLALERVPIVARIHRALQHSSDGTLREGFFLDLLHRQFSNDEARAQLETAIDWARYAELFEYDAARGEIKLDAPHPAAT